jgi:hypothetical protein
VKRHRPLRDGGEPYPDPVHQPVPPLRAVLTRPVVLSIANCFLLSFTDMALRCLQPLFFATPVHLGGMGLQPPTIGLCLGIFGLLDGAVQGLFFAKVIRRVGLKRLFLLSLSCFVPLFGLFPIINHFARAWGRSPVVWALVVFHLLLNCVTEMAFGRGPLLDSRQRNSHGSRYICRQVACSYTSPLLWPTRGRLGARTGWHKPPSRSPERWTSDGSVPLRVHTTE